jgi:cytochrome bd-type quinol oxidase subunit 2
MKKIFILLVIMFSLVAVMPAHAQLNKALGNLTKSAQGTGLEKQGDLATTVGNVIKAVLALTGTIFLILTIYAGILWMTAAGNEERVKKATSIITTAVVGLIIVMAAYAITFFVTTRLGGGAPGAGSTGSSDMGCCRFPDEPIGAQTPQASCGGTWTPGSC